MQWIAKSRLVRPDGTVIEPGAPLPPMPPGAINALLRGGHIVQEVDEAYTVEPAVAFGVGSTASGVTTIPGIGPERAADLAAMEIYTLRDLVAADPAVIVQQLNKVNVDMVRDWQDFARTELEGDVDGEQRDQASTEEENAPCAHCGD
jgi:hypothetical protein